MKKLFSGQKLANLNTLILAVALIVTSWIFLSVFTPVFANPQQNRMIQLRQTSQRWIEINLSKQRLIAWQGNTPVYAIVVSTGKPATPTPPGNFTIREKRPLDRMRGSNYDVPNVPYAMYYHQGYAIHGAYWHHQFGTPVSHGCTNVAPDHAEWLFNWASIGTPIVVHY
ncbi:MAG: L,D-transpeptidase [Oscillatoria sp. PMC 1068.18]|nr:L,D-transpeptidase [Oscillatoria sp. PMC 1076.18]MEC4991633.1 L,D-transpeptidase [Oscillatoria sp. PMC 1068.18]